jgi:hypothetical protein
MRPLKVRALERVTVSDAVPPAVEEEAPAAQTGYEFNEGGAVKLMIPPMKMP